MTVSTGETSCVALLSGLAGFDGEPRTMTAQVPSGFREIVERYERTLLDGSSDPLDAAVSLIDDLNTIFAKGGLKIRGVPDSTIEHWYTRLAAAITNWVAHPDTRITKTGLTQLCRRKQSLAYIFAASGYRGMSHLLALMSTPGADGKVHLSMSRLPVLMAVSGLDDVPEELLQATLKQPPEILLILMLGWLEQRAVLTEQGERNRTILLSSGHLIENAELEPGQQVAQCVNAWMHSSYASTPNKHDIKASFNKLFARKFSESGIIPQQFTHKKKDKPRLVVIHERFTQNHAMFRCYARSINDLRKYFHTISFSDEASIDDASKDLFDEIRTIKASETNLAEMVKLIQRQKPDLIYYPSLGMSHWTVLMANLRLAPIQVMTLGHPATSRIPTIDYVYTANLEGELENIFSEKVLLGDEAVYFSPHPTLPETLPPLLPPSDREVRVAVNSKVMKLSHRLLEVCRKLVLEADYPVRFSFFPGERPEHYDGIDAAIRAQLPQATVFHALNYEQFLKEMCKCDLALAAFPFGNTNCTVDTSLLGLPTVAHFGPEGPAQTDKMVLRGAGLAEWLVCDSDEAYFQTALMLINNPDQRQAALNGLSRDTLRLNIFNTQTHATDNPFADLIWLAYNNHESLQTSPQRIFGYKQLMDDYAA